MDNDDIVIKRIIYSFTEFNLRDIIEINKNHQEFTISEFILCSCFIDQISGFRYNTEKVGIRYRQFVKDYLKDYNPDKLYKDLRNKLVHNYSIGEYYALTRNDKDRHLKVRNGITYLNLENFISDINSALDKYVSELSHDATIRYNALCWYAKFKIISKKE
jgi:hypothetical protein